MSAFEHHATVDKGLKMKIKRKNVDKMEKSKKDQNKNEQNCADTKSQSESSHSANGILADKTCKLSIFSDHEKSPKAKSCVTKKDKGKTLIVKNVKSDTLGGAGSTSANGIDILLGQSSGTMEPKLAETPAGKKDCIPDPYEFNAKVEDGISTGIPISKKLKMDKEKTDMASATTGPCTVHVTRDAATDTQDVAVVTDPDCLGPCEPGTQVTLEGIVWHESENGVLVVNVTWRGKTYVGTLLDATRHDWAPPRINCDSPTVELESRTPKGRGKRRGAANTPVNDTRTLRKGRRGTSIQTFTAPPSPAKSDISTGGLKRKGRPQDIDLSSNDTRCSKRCKSQVPTPNSETPTTDGQGYIECPEPNCNKKYRHANGLKYHQSHAHSNFNLSFDDVKEDMDTEDLPLSVMKNNVKKEKEAIKKDNDTNKKEPAKDNSLGDKVKWEISEIGSVSKIEQEESNNDDKEAGNNKNDQKLDNINSAKKKDSNGSNAKVSSGQNNSGNSVTTTISPISVTKSSNVVVLSPESSQGNSNSLPPVASQMPSTSTNLSSVSSLNTVTASTSLSLSSISSPTSKPALPSLISSIVSVTQSDTSKNEVKLVDIKPKLGTDMLWVTKPNRPIVPAPLHTVVANVQVTHSNLSPVMSHTQLSPQLKPIQPKPTIMGEPQSVNQSLADLNKDRKKMQKKRPKEGTGSTPNRPEQPTIKIERAGVIKPNPVPISSKQLCEQNRKDGSRSNDSQRSQTLAPHSHKGADFPHSRGIQNPNLLKIGSPLQVNTPDNAKGLVTDDVQSPAYSDISDANESTSPAALSDTSPQKTKRRAC